MLRIFSLLPSTKEITIRGVPLNRKLEKYFTSQTLHFLTSLIFLVFKPVSLLYIYIKLILLYWYRCIDIFLIHICTLNIINEVFLWMRKKIRMPFFSRNSYVKNNMNRLTQIEWCINERYKTWVMYIKSAIYIYNIYRYLTFLISIITVNRRKKKLKQRVHCYWFFLDYFDCIHAFAQLSVRGQTKFHSYFVVLFSFER